MGTTIKDICDMIDYLPGNYMVYENDGIGMHYLYHTKGISAMLGFSDEEIASVEYAYQMALEEDRIMMQRVFSTELIRDNSGENHEILARMLHRTKGFIWVHLSGRQYAEVDGKAVWIVGMTDVTKETDISYALMESSDRFICVIEKSTKRILYGNSKFFDLIDSNPSEAMGRHCYELLCKVLEMGTNDNCLCYSSLNADPPIETYNPDKNLYITLTGREVVWGEYDAYVFYMTDITDKKRKEEELADSQKRFEVALENSELMVWEYDMVNNRCIASQKARGDYNIPLIIENYPESLYTMGHTPPETVEQIKDVKRRLMNGETGFSLERRTVNKDGKSEWQKVEYTLECDANGKPIRAIVCGLDITKQKEMEGKYEEQMEYRNKFAQNSMFSGRLDLDSDRLLDYTSTEPEFERIAGNAETASKLLEDFFAGIEFDDDNELSREKLTIQALKETYDLGQSQYRTVCTYDALSRYLDLNLSIYRNPGSRHLEMFCIVTDVTENVLKQKTLEAVANDGYDFVALVDVESGKANMIAVSPAAVMPPLPEGWQIDYDKIITQFAEEIRETYQSEKDFHAVSDEMMLSTIRKKLEYAPVYEFSCRTQTDIGGIKTFRMHFSYLNDTKKYIIYTRSNITKAVREEHLIQQKLEKALKEAKEAGQAKMDFLSRMSHDMRTPMNGIIGMTRLTQELEELPPEAAENLAAIADSSGYLLQLINDTLDMSKIENKRFELSPEAVRASDMIQHVFATIKPLADAKDIRLFFDSQNADLGYVWVDRTRLEQIFMNIVSNAVKFTPVGGRIHWSIETLKRVGKVSSCRLCVEDNGCGMSEQYLNHIFEPFSQEKTRIISGQEGTGLGMSIVKNLVELMNGQIEIESHPGEGTRVIVYLDFVRVQVMPEEPQKALPAHTENLIGKRILLAEDHPLNTTIARRILAKKGILVDHAENGRQAVEQFAASSAGYYDAILMDIRMPEMDGLQAARKIRTMNRSDAGTIPIIAMTANAYAEDVQAVLRAGMNAHIAKPFDPEILYDTLMKEICEPKK